MIGGAAYRRHYPASQLPSFDGSRSAAVLKRKSQKDAPFKMVWVRCNVMWALKPSINDASRAQERMLPRSSSPRLR